MMKVEKTGSPFEAIHFTSIQTDMTQTARKHFFESLPSKDDREKGDTKPFGRH